jgi:MFS family permease
LTDASAPQTRRFGALDRRALVAVALQFFVNGALFASFIPRLPEIRDRVGISIAGLGLLMSVAGVSGLIGSATVGPAISRFGTRRVILAAGTLVSLSLAVVGVASTPLLLLAGLVGMLTFDVLVDVAMNLQGSWLSARRHAPVMNRLHGLWSLGTVIGGLSSSRIAAAGISLTVHLVGAAAVLLAVIGVVSRGLLRIDEHPADHQVPPPSPDAPARSGRRPTPVLVLFLLAGFFAVAIESTSIEWAAFRFTDDFGSTAGFAALAYVAVTGGMTVGRFAGDWVSVRMGGPRLTLVSVVATGAGLGMASFSGIRGLSLAGYAIAGLGIATMLPTLYDTAAKHPGRPGVGLGALTAGLRIASLIIPLIVGTLAATGLSVGAAIAVVTLPSLLGYLAVMTALSDG